MPPEALGGDNPTADQTDLDILNGGSTDEGTGSDTPPETTETETPPEGEEPPVTEEEPEDVEETEEGKEKPPVEEDKDKPKVEEGKTEETGLVKALKDKYPNLLKEFPAVRKAIFQSREYETMFPTVDEAREAAQRVQDYDEYEQHIMNGESAILFRSIVDSGEEGPQVLEKFVLNLLPTIEKFSPDLKGKMLFPYIRNILLTAQKDGESTGNKNLALSVKHISKYLWNRFDLPDVPKAPRIEDNPEALRIARENETLRSQRAQEFQGEVISSGVSELKRMVEASLVKDKNFSPIERRALVEQIVSETRRALHGDAQYNRQINSLWRRAAQAGHSRESIPRIVATFLGGAKSTMPTIRARVVAGALKEKGITPAGVGRDTGGTRTSSPVRSGKVVSPRQIDYSRTSDLDILSDKVTLKK
jgi:hypothetical protein